MRILGIDPGTSLIGYGVVDISNTSFKAIDYGPFRTEKNINNKDRVIHIKKFFDTLIKKHKPDQIAIETLFFTKNAKTAIKVAEIRGVFLLIAAMNSVPVLEVTPLQVKQSVAMYGRADKAQIQKAVKLICNLDEIPKPDDVADALAIAIAAGSIY